MRYYHPENGETLVENIGHGDGVTCVFTAMLGFAPVEPGSLIITYGDKIIDADEAGNLLLGDQAVGCVSHSSGMVTINFPEAPKAGMPIRGTYRYCLPESRLYRMETDSKGRIILIPVKI